MELKRSTRTSSGMWDDRNDVNSRTLKKQTSYHTLNANNSNVLISIDVVNLALDERYYESWHFLIHT